MTENRVTPAAAFVRGIRDYRAGIKYNSSPLGWVCQTLSHWQNGWLDALQGDKESEQDEGNN
jgi:hypothetical protein